MSNIIFDNKDIEKYVMFKLDKIENTFTEDELDTIKEILLSFKNDFVFLDELLNFRCLESLTLRNFYIHDYDIDIFLKLNNLNEIVFEKCTFEDSSKISKLNIKSLSFINCEIEDLSFLNDIISLESLSIVNGNITSNIINSLINLTYLELSYSNISGNILLNNISDLFIDNTNILDLSFIYNFHNLKKLSIDENQYNNNKEIINNLRNNGITVLNENMSNFGD